MSVSQNSISKVGVLLVHGVGEQRQFEHLEEVARNLVQVLQEQHEQSKNSTVPDETIVPDENRITRVTVDVRTTNDATFGSNQKNWKADDNAPVIISVEVGGEHVTELHLHEVWWADLDEPTTLKTQASFWKWGFALWLNPGYIKDSSKNDSNSVKDKNDSYRSNGKKIRLLDRFALFGVAMVIALTQPVLSILSLILRQLFDSKLKPDILVQYIGDVKLYQQKGRAAKGPLLDIGAPPREAIQRRMISALARMALDDNDRWYIMAHSLGTIVAFDSLNREENNSGDNSKKLFDYLDYDLKKRWKEQHETEDISKQVLFSKLRGFLSYGSPYSRFLTLWPAIVVPILNNRRYFNQDFVWINVYDPSDPVSAKIIRVPKEGGSSDNPNLESKNDNGELKPHKEYAYKTDSYHLLSHTSYLTFKAGQDDRLINLIANWLLKGGEFEPGQSNRWINDSRRISRRVRFQILIWFLLVLGIPIVLSLMAAVAQWLLKSTFPHWSTILLRAVIYIAVAVVVVLVAGSYEHLRRQIENKGKKQS